MTKARFIRARYFIWTVVPLALFAFAGIPGDVHVIWSYEWRALGPDSGTDFSQRHYTRCTYVGAHRAITEYPTDGKCGWLRFSRDAGEPS